MTTWQARASRGSVAAGRVRGRTSGAAEPVVQDGSDLSLLGAVRPGSVQAMRSSRSSPVTVTTVGEVSGSGASFTANPTTWREACP